jgi:hypothetical protein
MILYSKRETREEEKVLDTEAPVSSEIMVTPNPVEVNAPFTFSATLDDCKTGGSKISSAEFSVDGSTWIPMLAADGAMDSPIEKIMVKTSVEKPGVYSLQVRGADEMGNAASEKAVVLIVYDPENGFVKGEGWLDSPQGAFADNLSLAGKASFKFIAKYKKKANIPSGETEFVFAPADMTFKSTSYDWLVVSGAEALYKGVGTINGEDKYGFELIVVDEKFKREGGLDKFRIKIWNTTTGKTVYDNGLGGPEDVPPTTSIAGGDISIEKPPRKKSR